MAHETNAEKAKREASEERARKEAAEAKSKTEAEVAAKAAAESARPAPRAEPKASVTERVRPATAQEVPAKTADPYPSQADLNAIKDGSFHRRRRDVRPEKNDGADYKTR